LAIIRDGKRISDLETSSMIAGALGVCGLALGGVAKFGPKAFEMSKKAIDGVRIAQKVAYGGAFVKEGHGLYGNSKAKEEIKKMETTPQPVRP
jgi:hypothetical protein